MDNVLQKAGDLMPELTAHRRWLHQHAETGFDLTQTKEYVRRQLTEMGYAPADCGRAGLVALVGGKKPGKVFLLRADMDALPMGEESGDAFACPNGKTMHACGHDMHTAMLLGAAKLLKAHEDEICGTVKLMFQPSEETFEGSKDMIAAGVLENPRPDAAAMIHVTAGSPMPAGSIIVCGPGVGNAAADYFTIRVQGKGCHGSTPQDGVDALTVAAHILLALQNINARELSCTDEAVLTIGTLQGGTASNVIADSAVLGGTMRTFDEKVRAFVKERMEAIVSGVAATFRATAAVEYGSCCPTLYNDPALVKTAGGILKELLGNSVFTAQDLGKVPRGGGSEDFAYISQEVPSLMLALAAGEPARGYAYPQHHPKVRFDEEVLPIGVAAFVQLALRYLEENQ